MPVNRKRLLEDLRTLATFGKCGTGVDRTAFSGEDVAARLWLRERMQAAGLETAIDGYGNVFGRMPGRARAVLLGSHTDTVPKGGWLDGALGVICALEVARCIAESGTDGIGADAVSFQDEEGTFMALLGSRAFCGENVGNDIAKAKNAAGVPLSDAIRTAAFPIAGRAALDPSRHVAYFEAHIEQGPRLEAQGIKIGVVTAIVGIRSFRIAFTGRADHAGTTPMGMRSDAGAAAMAFANAVDQRYRAAAGPDTVWNLGVCTFLPGANNVVPAEAQLGFQFRDVTVARLDAMEHILHEEVARAATAAGAGSTVTKVLETVPTPMDAALQGHLEAAARAQGVSLMKLPSGAGHDAITLSRYLPSAMLFVPSIGGRSHHVSENTSDDDIVTGADVLLDAVRRCA